MGNHYQRNQYGLCSSIIQKLPEFEIRIPVIKSNSTTHISRSSNRRFHFDNSPFQNYLHVCEVQRELNDKTVKAYRIDISQFLDYLEVNQLSFDKKGINSYLDYLHDKYKQRTVKRKIATIGIILSFEPFPQTQMVPFDKSMASRGISHSSEIAKEKNIGSISSEKSNEYIGSQFDGGQKRGGNLSLSD